MQRLLIIGLVLVPFAAWGQSSANFNVTSSTFNSGGTPGNGPLTSANYRVSVAAIGEAVPAANLASPSFSMSIGFVASNHSPPVVIFSDGFESVDASLWTPAVGVLKKGQEDLNAPGKSVAVLLLE